MYTERLDPLMVIAVNVIVINLDFDELVTFVLNRFVSNVMCNMIT